MHVLRRNLDVKLLMFNNQIYGLTKGQYSPTSPIGKKAKSTPLGSVDYPVDPVSLALGAGATFVGRTLDVAVAHIQEMLKRAAAHQGTAFVEIYQNCNIFNDGAFDLLTRPDSRDSAVIRLTHGQPITFGKDGEFCVVHPPGGFGLEVRSTAGVSPEEIVVHDETVAEPAYAFALSRLPALNLSHTPIGVFRKVDRPSYDHLVRTQVETASATVGDPAAELAGLLTSGDTWTIL
jgi:2-oxoglutarate ferredoxin oxidoreductase subunit beta